MTQAKKDDNGIPVLLGVSNVDGVTPVMVYVDPVTHRMLVDLAGGGTVTSVSVVTANGVSGSVATSTTTPAITLTLGDITPTSVSVTGTAGAGYIDLIQQSVEPANPVAGTVRIHGETSATRTFPEFMNESGKMIVVGRDSVFVAKNTSGGAITLGQAVYINGAVGNNPTVGLAKADSITTIGSTIGIVIETSIANNGFGHIMIVGLIPDIVTTGYTAGDLIYVSATTAGAFTATPPAYPNFQKKVGTILTVGVNGSILVNVAPFTGGLEVGTNAPSYSVAGSIELGHATDTTISRVSAGVIAVEGVTVPTISSTSTLTNKRVTKRTGTTTSHATPTINTDNVDEYYITAQAEAITSFTTNLSGTPTLGQTLFISVVGTAARAITWGASFANGPVALPTTTVTTTQLSTLFKWDGSIWRCYATGSTV